MKTERSQAAYARASRVIPGGVNSPVRAYKAVGHTPLFIARGRGPHVYDLDGNQYIDHVCSWGPLILGHAHPDVVAAIHQAVTQGASFGAPTENETRLASLIVQRIPSIEKVRLVNSGTEAAMSAVRLARGFTGRDLVVKFDGCYHGHVDALLVSAGSGAATFGVPSSPGIPRAYAGQTLILPFNDLDRLAQVFARQGDDIAAVIAEPVMANMGVIAPEDGFLQGMRELTRKHGSLLILDEVITGFRLAPGGAQEYFGVQADLTTLGKIIGGGLPVGAYGGRAEIMDYVAPAGPVYQAGTLSGNPVAVAAGIATIERLDAGTYRLLDRAGRHLAEGLREAAGQHGVCLQVAHMGSLLGFSFLQSPPRNAGDMRHVDTRRYACLFHAMLRQGVYLAPSAFEACFVSTAHDLGVIDETIRAFAQVFEDWRA